MITTTNMWSFKACKKVLTTTARPASPSQQVYASPQASFSLQGTLRPSCRAVFARTQCSRVSPTLVGQSGREYIKGNVFHRYIRNGDFYIHRAECEGQSFVIKRVHESVFQLSNELKDEFADSRHLRMHVDSNTKEQTLVYEYFKDTFLDLLNKHPDFPLSEIKKILRCTGEAVKELHARDWIHIDIKPDNILVDWTLDFNDKPKVTKVALGDLDLSLKLINERPLRAPYAIGNVMWRSPEGQSGKGIAKASDVYAFGLVCIYGLGGGPMLILNNGTLKSLIENEMPFEEEIVVRHFLYFGPLPEGLLQHVKDETWDILYKEASDMAEKAAIDDPDFRFGRWPETIAPHLTPQAKDMISGMMNLDPAARVTIDEVLEHPWWKMTV